MDTIPADFNEFVQTISSSSMLSEHPCNYCNSEGDLVLLIVQNDIVCGTVVVHKVFTVKAFVHSSCKHYLSIRVSEKIKEVVTTRRYYKYC